jgi:hypothetical protein
MWLSAVIKRARIKRWLVLIPLIAGCGTPGPDLALVSGRVTFDGRPLPAARLTFQPEASGSPSYGATGPDGRYELLYKRDVKGAMLGWHTVRIKVDSGDSTPNGEKALPARYNTETKLRREVVSGENVFDFELTSEK